MESGDFVCDLGGRNEALVTILLNRDAQTHQTFLLHYTVKIPESVRSTNHLLGSIRHVMLLFDSSYNIPRKPNNFQQESQLHGWTS